MDRKFKVTQSTFKTCNPPPGMEKLAMTIGIVVIESLKDRDTIGWKSYMGFAMGHEQNYDEQFVAHYGAKLTLQEALGFFPDLDPELHVQ